jgi:hypothetical protein
VRAQGIDRRGHLVKVDAELFSTTEPPIYLPYGQAASVPKGRYWIAAEVDTLSATNATLNATLVMRPVHITRSETVKLDARPGRLVRFALLGVPGAADTSDSVQACLGGSFVPPASYKVTSAPGTLYAVPVRSPVMTIGYGSLWQGQRAGYYISGNRRGGIPVGLEFRSSLAEMARLTAQFRSGELPAPYQNAYLQPMSACGIGFGPGLALTTPDKAQSFTEYVRPGQWTASAYAYRAFWPGAPMRLAGGHHYTDVFGRAVWGLTAHEGLQASSGDGGEIFYFPDSLFADPGQDTPFADECCDIGDFTLSLHGHVIKHQVLNEWRSQRYFTAHAPSAGWYTMTIKARRWSPGERIHADLLSRTQTVTWHFFAAPRSVPGSAQPQLPVRVARIVPLGLNMDNQAASGGKTTLRIQFLGPHAPGLGPVPIYRLTTVRVQASFDGGKAWHPLRLTRHGSTWLATVHDPAAAGFVALRTFAADSHGDTSAQTFYQAYAVS